MRKESTIKNWVVSVLIALPCLFLVACSANKASTSQASAGSDSGAVYTVKRGDTLYRISRITGSDVGELARLNGIRAPYTLEIGQRLRVKGSSGSASAKKKTAVAKSPKPRSSASGSASVAKVAAPPPGARCWRWPANGKIIEPFSTSDGGNKGIDIAGSRGQPVYASASGTVVYVGNQLRGYGNLVMIKHTEDYITAYAHNDTTLVSNGQKVSAGQKIATMGSSGSDSVNLHFQIRYRATALDPQRYLPPQGSKPSC